MAKKDNTKFKNVTEKLPNGVVKNTSRVANVNRTDSETRFKEGNKAAELKPMSELEAIARIAKFPDKNTWPKRRITECFHTQLGEIVTLHGKPMRAEEAIARQVMAKALAGDLNAFDRIIDRVEGRPNQSLEVSGPDKGPIKALSVTMTMQEMASFYARSVVDEDAIDVMAEEA